MLPGIEAQTPNPLDVAVRGSDDPRLSRADALVGRLKSIADPTRLKILVLLEGGTLGLSQLIEALGIPFRPTLSRALTQLMHARLIDVEGSGPSVRYGLTSDGARVLRSVGRMLPPSKVPVSRDVKRPRPETYERDGQKHLMTRYLSLFDKESEEIAGRLWIRGVPLGRLRRLFGMPRDNPLFDCYPVGPTQLPFFQGLFPWADLDPERFDLFLECHAS